VIKISKRKRRKKRKKRYENIDDDSIIAKRKIIVDIKNSSKCVYCFSKRNLQFHHIDRSIKFFNVGYSPNLEHISILDVLNEMEKCMLVCQRCHTEIHKDD